MFFNAIRKPGVRSASRDIVKSQDATPLFLIYPCGSKGKKGKEYDAEYAGHCVRVADELGVDIVNVNYTGSPETFKHVVAACKIPVVVSDGPKMGSEKELLDMVEGAMWRMRQGF